MLSSRHLRHIKKITGVVYSTTTTSKTESHFPKNTIATASYSNVEDTEATNEWSAAPDTPTALFASTAPQTSPSHE